MPRQKLIAFRPTATELEAINAWATKQGINKTTKAVRQIITQFIHGGLTAKPQKRQPTSQEVRVEGKAPPHVSVRQFYDSPLIKQELKRFMRGQHSGLIQGLLSIDEHSFSMPNIAGSELGILMHIPATIHDIEAGGQ